MLATFLLSWIRYRQIMISRECECVSLSPGLDEEQLNSCLVTLYFNSY